MCCSGATQLSSTDDEDYAAAVQAELDRKRHRIKNQTSEQTEADCARHRQINQTPEQIEAHRMRQLRINQTPKQAEADRSRHRQMIKTPERQNEQRERVSAIHRRPPQHNIARRPLTDNQVECHQLGHMNQHCRHWGTKTWLGESASMCCGNGRVCLPELEPPPDALNRLLLGQDKQCTEFRSKIRVYNSKVIDRFLGEVQTYTSVDSVLDQRAAALYPTKFLNALNLSRILPHELKLKLNCQSMLMQNLNALGNLCNDTQMIYRGFRPHVIEAEIISESHIGRRVFLREYGSRQPTLTFRSNCADDNFRFGCALP
jgi:hypothetical protein